MKIKILLPSLAVLTVLFILFTSCHKGKDPAAQPPVGPTPPVTPVPPVPSLPPYADNNKWECLIDGVPWSGTVDTSFISIGTVDTIVYCRGTSADKKGNIYLIININRQFRTTGKVNTHSYGLFMFDTLSMRPMMAGIYTPYSNITYTVDTLNGTRLKASFSGTAEVLPDGALRGASTHTITNGKFSCEMGRGNSEPKTFLFNSDGTKWSGYLSSAKLISNTLIMEGFPYSYNGEQRFKLMVRTGGTIKKGTYTSASGDAGLQLYVPSIYPLYITDYTGDLSVTINSVDGNIITGSFSGSSNGKQISGGIFTCRVQNYVPQADAPGKWAFSKDESIQLYEMYGGNVVNAQKTQAGNRYLLTVNGESDNGTSTFKLVLNSATPFTPGVYKTDTVTNRLDSLYFTSDTKIWNGNTTYFFLGYGTTYCRIDSIDAYSVSGILYGRFNMYYSPNAFAGLSIGKGRFRAIF